jgi:hypothetical protein
MILFGGWMAVSVLQGPFVHLSFWFLGLVVATVQELLQAFSASSPVVLSFACDEMLVICVLV